MTTALRQFGKRALIALSQVLSIPVFFAYEGFVRAVNVGRQRAKLPADAATLLASYYPDLDLSTVRIVQPAVIPSARGSTSALTLGTTIFSKVEPDPTSTRAMWLMLHELMHVDQNRRHGRPGFARRYGVGWARTLNYRDIPLEAEAFAYEASCRDELRAEVASRQTP